MPALTAPLILDADRAIANMGGEELYLTVIERFVANQGQVVQSIMNALAANDRQAAERLAHTLRGLAATIGATTLAETALQLETSIRKEETRNYPHLIDATVTGLGQAITAISAYLQAHAAVADATQPDRAPLDPAQLDKLLAQLTAQLWAFDSDAGDTMRQINRLVEGTETALRFVRLEQYVNSYNYEDALTEVQRLGMAQA